MTEIISCVTWYVFMYFAGSDLIADISECDSSPCLNGGICSEPQLDMYECNCTNTGYQGRNCQTGNKNCQTGNYYY